MAMLTVKNAKTSRRGRPRKRIGLADNKDYRAEKLGLHEHVAQNLRELIIRGDIPPGSPLIEAELSALLGVSRTPLREGIKLLAQEGLVELRANRSACVRSLRLSEVTELYEALAGIERMAAELAAERINQQELEELERLQTVIQHEHDIGDRINYFSANQAIHKLIVRAARNRPLADAHAPLVARSEQVRYFMVRLNPWQESIDEHQAILDALKAHKPKLAGRLLGAHVQKNIRIVAQYFTTHSDAGFVEGHSE
jgi:DNA-binding GntR family transcriptional regulator